MKFKRFLWVILISGMVVACGGPKVMVSNKDLAKTAEMQGNYEQATQAWKQYFNQTAIEETSGVDFANAAKTAFNSGDIDLSLSWFDQARYKDYSDAGMYMTLAKIFNAKKNISKELSALEYYRENFSKTSKEINSRLFDVYYEIDSYEKALLTWDLLDENTKNELEKLNSYFLIKLNAKDSVICDSVSLVILEKDPNNMKALEWNAKKYYWLGENRYQSEMDKYEKNKTTRQYKILLKELELATTDLKKSLTYFEKLWEMETGKEYASYFASIYARFGDEKKSKSYQKYMK